MEKHLVLSCSIWKAVKKDDESNVQGGTGMRERDMIPCRSKCLCRCILGTQNKQNCVLYECVCEREADGRRKKKRERESHGLLGSNLETNKC